VTLLVCADIFNKQSAFWKSYRYADKKSANCNHGQCEKLVDRAGELATIINWILIRDAPDIRSAGYPVGKIDLVFFFIRAEY
jgi:hypothetical protein